MGETQRISENRDMLVNSRNTGRTFGCVGFSMSIHVAILAALFAISPSRILDMAGGDGSMGGGSVSMVEGSGNEAEAISTAAVVTDTPALQEKTVEVSTAPAVAAMTDEASEVVAPAKPVVDVAPKAVVKPVAVTKPKVTSKPVAKSVEKPIARPKVIVEDIASDTPVETSEDVATEAPEQTAVTPVERTPVEPVAAVEEAPVEQNEEPAPTLLANPPSDDEPTPVKEAPQARKAEKPVQEEPAPPVAAVVSADHGSDAGAARQDSRVTEGGTSGSQNAVASSTGSSNSNENNNGSGAGDSRGAGAGSAIGPIRDASELKPLPGNPNPVYPARDRLARKQGTSVVLGRVTPDGRVTDVRVEKSSGSQAMDNASVQAFRGWRFQSGQEGMVRKPFQFRLVGDAMEVPVNPLGKGLKR